MISIVLLVLDVQELDLILHRGISIIFVFFLVQIITVCFSRVPWSVHEVLFDYQFDSITYLNPKLLIYPSFLTFF